MEEFKRYYRELATDKEWRRTFGFTEGLGEEWERLLAEHPSWLIVWRLGEEIVGHAIWHESSTDEHRKGDPRDIEDRKILRELLGGKQECVELHEVWLRKEYRGQGFGERFFVFFKELMKGRGYDAVVYYADYPAAIAICRKLGWKEAYWKQKNWHIFCLRLNNNG